MSTPDEDPPTSPLGDPPAYGVAQAQVAALIPQAVIDNHTYLTLDHAPTLQEVTDQVRRLTRQMQAVARQQAGDWSDVSDVTTP